MIPKILQNDELRFCRIKKKTKKPFEKDWTNKPYTYQEIMKFLPGENYGVLCGHGGLAVIDCDDEVFQEAIEAVFPKTYRVKTGGGGTHNYFFIPDLKQKIILEVDDKHLGEVQSHGTQVVAPNSIHKSGKKYEEVNQHPIVNLPCEELFDKLKPFMKKEIKNTEENLNFERNCNNEIDNLSVADIWGTSGLKQHSSEYYGSHPGHGSKGGTNFWINPLKNMWHCFRCQSGGGVLSAIAVKEGILDCSEARKGNLRGDKAIRCIEIAKSKYGLKETDKSYPEKQGQDKNNLDFNIIWLNELKNYKEEDKEWIIDKLIPTKSVIILAGKRGTLKTFVTLLMAYSIASGNPFLEKFSTRKGGVIYLDKENGIGIMKKRTLMINKELKLDEKDLRIGFICFSQIKLDKVGGIVAIEKVIEEHQPRLLIVDTYRRSVSFDENDAGKVSALFVDTLRPLVERYDVSLLLIHHNRKGSRESTDEMDEMRGSSDLANYADIILKTERRGGNLILKQLKNRNAEEEKPIKIRVEFGENSDPYVKLTYEGEFMKQGRVERCVEMMTLWLEGKGIRQFKTSEAKAIAFKSGVKETTFKGALKLMEDTGIIENIGFGLYNVHV